MSEAVPCSSCARVPAAGLRCAALLQVQDRTPPQPGRHSCACRVVAHRDSYSIKLLAHALLLACACRAQPTACFHAPASCELNEHPACSTLQHACGCSLLDSQVKLGSKKYSMSGRGHLTWQCEVASLDSAPELLLLVEAVAHDQTVCCPGAVVARDKLGVKCHGIVLSLQCVYGYISCSYTAGGSGPIGALLRWQLS
jgi:hypothetical protein